MERETLTITTPIEKHEVVLKAYLTGREKRQINAVFLKGVEFETKDKTQMATAKGFKGSLIEEAENVAFETVIVSVDGATDKKIDKVLDMHEKDYRFVVEEINKVTRDADFEEKKTT